MSSRRHYVRLNTFQPTEFHPLMFTSQEALVFPGHQRSLWLPALFNAQEGMEPVQQSSLDQWLPQGLERPQTRSIEGCKSNPGVDDVDQM